MTDRTDAELLERFARNDSETAFAALVERYIGLVHSVALRHTANPQHAQDITQAVFIILARKAGSLTNGGWLRGWLRRPRRNEVEATPRRHDERQERRGVAATSLSGWLYQTARLTAANFRRSEQRRIRREQEVFMQSSLEETAPDEVWPELSPLLDDAMGSLGATDRDAIVLRYFQNKTLPEVGASLGMEERAAQKRVSRALEKLRKIFTKRGVTLTTTIIAGVVSADSVQAAPVGLAVTVSATAAKGTAVAASITTLVQETMKIMTWMKLKFAAGVGVIGLLVGGAAIVAQPGSVSSPLQFRIVVDAGSADSEALTSTTTNNSGQVIHETLHVQKEVLLDQTAIGSASVSTNSLGGREIYFVLTPTGREQFAKVTRENIGRRLAIVVDGKVLSAPVIRSEISGGRGQISGNFSEREAIDLAARIGKPPRN